MLQVCRLEMARMRGICCCPWCCISPRYWSHKTHSITTVWLLKSHQKTQNKTKENPSSWKLVPKSGLHQVFTHWKGHTHKMWVPVASLLKINKWIQWRQFSRTSSVLLEDLKLFTALNGTVTLVLGNHYLMKPKKICIFFNWHIYADFI